MQRLNDNSMTLLLRMIKIIRNSSDGTMTATQVHRVAQLGSRVSRNWTARLLRHGVRYGMLTLEGYYYTPKSVSEVNRIVNSMGFSPVPEQSMINSSSVTPMGEALALMNKLKRGG